MVGSSLLNGFRKAMAILLATLIFVAVLEGHSARAYFATPSDHVHQVHDNADEPSEREASKSQPSHVHFEDHSHNFGYGPTQAGLTRLIGNENRWVSHNDPTARSRLEGLLRPPRTFALR